MSRLVILFAVLALAVVCYAVPHHTKDHVNGHSQGAAHLDEEPSRLSEVPKREGTSSGSRGKAGDITPLSGSGRTIGREEQSGRGGVAQVGEGSGGYAGGQGGRTSAHQGGPLL